MSITENQRKFNGTKNPRKFDENPRKQPVVLQHGLGDVKNQRKMEENKLPNIAGKHPEMFWTCSGNCPEKFRKLSGQVPEMFPVRVVRASLAPPTAYTTNWH